MNSKSSSSYLPHIDGLRAIAVLSVLFYHFGVPGFPGGYIGVDIFFVISGFLISRIIFGELDAMGRFNYVNFYKRRIGRLFPALLIVLLTTTVCAVVLFTPENLVKFGGSLAAAAISVSNMLFWTESGYFDTSALLKPLLHTWSLSVEEQFYFVWPMLMVVAWRINSVSGRFILILVVGIISFYLNHIYVSRGEMGYSATIFFLTPFRVFEFALGALGALTEKKHPRNQHANELMCLVGLMLIVFSIESLHKDSIFPYVNSLAPCFGALLVIMAKQSRICVWLLRNKLSVFIGLISYSLYLVHWPILVFTEYVFFKADSVKMITLMTIAAFVSASLIYVFVEKPSRSLIAKLNKTWIYVTLILLMLSFGFLGLSIKLSDGWVWRYNLTKSSEHKIDQGHSERDKIFTPLTATDIENGKANRFSDLSVACNLMELENKQRCHMDRPIQILVFGNSHEPDAFNMLNYMYGYNSQVNIINFGTVNGCQFEVNGNELVSKSVSLNCGKRFAILNSPEFIGRINYIVYNTHTGFEAVAASLWNVLGVLLKKNKGIHLIAIGSYIETSTECATLYNRTQSFDSCKSPKFVKYFNVNEKDKSPIPEVKILPYFYISKYKLLCGSGNVESCLVFANHEPMFYDSHHLSRGFARYLGMLISNSYGKDLVELGLPPPNRNPDFH